MAIKKNVSKPEEPKPFTLEGQKWKLMVGHWPKASIYCIVKKQNGTGIQSSPLLTVSLCKLWSDHKKIKIKMFPLETSGEPNRTL